MSAIYAIAMAVVDQDLASRAHDQAKYWTDLLSHVVFPAAATLVPVGVTALFKIGQSRSRSRRSDLLTGRISDLARKVADIPDLIPPDPECSPKDALRAELRLAVEELKALQSRGPYTFRDIKSVLVGWVQDTLLLYKPHGFLSWVLQGSFYAYTIIFLFFVSVAVVPDSSAGDAKSIISTSSSAADVVGYVVLIGVLSIPLLVLHHYAAKRHNKIVGKVAGAAVGS
jgi:hypothetical protein